MTTKVQFGSGHNKLAGWKNYDREVDIRKALPLRSHSVDFVYAEHVIEHVSHIEGMAFLEECHRILRHEGIIRIAFPNITQVFPDVVKTRDIVRKWGHRSVWTDDIAVIFLSAAGFKPSRESYGCSSHPDLRGVEGHHLVLGDNGLKLAIEETTIYEGIRL